MFISNHICHFHNMKMDEDVTYDRQRVVYATLRDILVSMDEARSEARANQSNFEFKSFCDSLSIYRRIWQLPFIAELLLELVLTYQEGDLWITEATDEQYCKAVDTAIDTLMEEAANLDRFRREFKELAITMRDKERERQARIERHNMERQIEDNIARTAQLEMGKCLQKVDGDKILVTEGQFQYYVHTAQRYCKRKAAEAGYCRQHYLMQQNSTEENNSEEED